MWLTQTILRRNPGCELWRLKKSLVAENTFFDCLIEKQELKNKILSLRVKVDSLACHGNDGMVIHRQFIDMHESGFKFQNQTKYQRRWQQDLGII